MPFDPNSAKKAGKNLKEDLQKKKDLPSKKRWKCSMKKCWMICYKPRQAHKNRTGKSFCNPV